MISYHGYMTQIQELGFSKLSNFEKIKMFSLRGDQYNYWIPCYLDEEHFTRNYQLIINSICVIRNGIDGSKKNDFKPEIVLDVLPCLINKTIVNILNGTIYHSLAAIQAYCHLLRLYFRLINDFPPIKNAIDRKLHEFKSTSSMRSKKNFPDLGEFIINIFLATNFSYDDIKGDLFREFLARKIFWVEKNEKRRLDTINRKQIVETLFNNTIIANQLLMFNIQAAKFFISFQGMKEMDENIGFISQDLMTKFRDTILRIKNISCYREFLAEIKINEYDTEEKLIDVIFSCRKVAVDCGYLRSN
jgi:hypothetical protein